METMIAKLNSLLPIRYVGHYHMLYQRLSYNLVTNFLGNCLLIFLYIIITLIAPDKFFIAIDELQTVYQSNKQHAGIRIVLFQALVVLTMIKKSLRFPIKNTCKPNKLIMLPLVLPLCWSFAPHETQTGISVFMSLILQYPSLDNCY